VKLNYGGKSSGGGGSSTYIRPTPMSITVGGANAGTTFNGTTADALDKVLYPDVTPNFTAFTITGVASSYEVGQLLPAASRTANWSTSASANVKPNSIDIIDVTNSDTVLASSLANTGNAPIPMVNIVYTVPTSHNFRIRGESLSSVIFQRILTINWMNRIYFGESLEETLSESDVITLRVNNLRQNINGDYVFTTLIGGYKWVCYPVSMGTRSSFIDPNSGFPVSMNPPQVLSLTNSFGVTEDYYCYRTFNSLSGAITIRIS
jgi:hypothetical protein